MINVAVINMRSLIKYIGIACLFIGLISLIRNVSINTNKPEQSHISEKIGSFSFVSCIEKTLPDSKTRRKCKDHNFKKFVFTKNAWCRT